MKSNVFKVLIALVFLAIFNVLFFLLGGFERTTSDWISYGFIHAAYLMILLVPLMAPKSKGLNTLTYSLYLRAIGFFCLELAIGLVFICWAKPESITWPLVVQGVCFALFLIFQLLGVVANDATESSIQKQKIESANIKELSLKIKSAMRDIDDEHLRSVVGKSFSAVDNSSIQSFADALDADLALRNAVDALCSAIENNDNPQIESKAKQVINAVHRRNDIIKKCRMNQ